MANNRIEPVAGIRTPQPGETVYRLNDDGGENIAPGHRLECVGQMALRCPDGTVAEAVKLYRQVPDEKFREDGLTDAEKALVDNIGNIFARKMKQYIDQKEETT